MLSPRSRFGRGGSPGSFGPGIVAFSFFFFFTAEDIGTAIGSVS